MQLPESHFNFLNTCLLVFSAGFAARISEIIFSKLWAFILKKNENVSFERSAVAAADSGTDRFLVARANVEF